MKIKLALMALAAAVLAGPALAQEKVLKYAHFQPARDDQQ